MPFAKITQRPVLRKVIRRQYPERHVFLQLLRYLARGKHAGRIRIDQHFQHHARFIGHLAPTIPFIGLVKCPQIQFLNHVTDEIRQMTLRQPLLKTGL